MPLLLRVPVCVVKPGLVSVTVPVGVGLPEVGLTVTVTVNGCAVVMLVELSATATAGVILGGALTVWVSGDEVERVLFASPEYVATMASVPTGNAEVVHCAAPEESGTAEQPLIELPFELNPTVPVGEFPPLTVAVKVTLCPEVEGFRLDLTVVVVCACSGSGVHDFAVGLLPLLSVNTIDGKSTLDSVAGVPTSVRLFVSPVYPVGAHWGGANAPSLTSVLTATVATVVDPRLNWAALLSP
jgi:hypothetical protein